MPQRMRAGCNNTRDTVQRPCRRKGLVIDMATSKKLPIVYRYTFRFGNGIERTFVASLNGETLDLIPQEHMWEYPAWTELYTWSGAQNKRAWSDGRVSMFALWQELGTSLSQEGCPLGRNAAACRLTISHKNLRQSFYGSSMSSERQTRSCRTPFCGYT